MKLPEWYAINYWRDLSDMTIRYKWVNNKGETVHEVVISERDQMDMPLGICPACLVYRGEVVAFVQHQKRPLAVCPACKGARVFGTANICTCAEVPHRLHCPMGFSNYFPLEG